MTMLNTHHWARETEQILAMARQALSESRSSDIRDLVQRLPINVQTGERPISLVFAGQYSSGKSTLLKALTGRDDIATGAGITTEEAHSYEWEGVTVIDTPGIHTSLRPDHDAISYEAISNSDLMVFVITNELFDSHLGQHYRKLAVDHEKAYETILVVNKMGRHANGNTPEAQAIITEDLRKPLELLRRKTCGSPSPTRKAPWKRRPRPTPSLPTTSPKRATWTGFPPISTNLSANKACWAGIPPSCTALTKFCRMQLN